MSGPCVVVHADLGEIVCHDAPGAQVPDDPGAQVTEKSSNTAPYTAGTVVDTLGLGKTPKRCHLQP